MIATHRRTMPRSQNSTRGAIGRLTLVLLAALLVSLSPLLAKEEAKADLRGLKQGDKVPDFALKDTKGKAFRLSEADGSTVVILFWNRSKKPSAKAAAAFAKFADAYKKKGVVFLAILETEKDNKSEGDTKPSAGRTARVLPDVGRVAFGKFGIIAMPSTCVVSPDGRLAKYFPLSDDRYPTLLAAAIELAEGKIDEAAWQKILHPVNVKIDPVLAKAQRLCRLADKYRSRGSYRLAEGAYRKSLKAKKDYGDAWLGLGWALLKQDKVKEALPVFETAAKTKHLKALSTLGKGIALRRLGKTKEAKKCLDIALRSPSAPSARVRYELGLIAESEKDRKSALRLYRKALETVFEND